MCHGARENNLKDGDVERPTAPATVFTGDSGSGKTRWCSTRSSLIERLIERDLQRVRAGLHAHAVARPDGDVLDGLTTIIVDQQRMGADVRSTVGTANDANALQRHPASRARAPSPPAPRRPAQRGARSRRSGTASSTRREQISEPARVQHHRPACARAATGRARLVRRDRARLPSLNDVGQLSVDEARAQDDPAPRLTTSPTCDGPTIGLHRHRAMTAAPTRDKATVAGAHRGVAIAQSTSPAPARGGQWCEGTRGAAGRDLRWRHLTPAAPDVGAHADGTRCAGRPTTCRGRPTSRSAAVVGPGGHSRAPDPAVSTGRRVTSPDPTRSRGATATTALRPIRGVREGQRREADLSAPTPRARHPPERRRCHRHRPGDDAASPRCDVQIVEIGLGHLSSTGHRGHAVGRRGASHRRSGTPVAHTDVTYVVDGPAIGLHPHDSSGRTSGCCSCGTRAAVLVEEPPEAIAMRHVVARPGTRAPTAARWCSRDGSSTSTGAARRRPDRGTLTDRAPGRPRAPRRGAYPVRDAPGARGHHPQPAGSRRRHPARRARRRDRGGSSGQQLLIHGSVSGRDGVAAVDQTPKRRLGRSNPATYTGLLRPDPRTSRSPTVMTEPAVFSATLRGRGPTCTRRRRHGTDLAMMADVADLRGVRGEAVPASVLRVPPRRGARHQRVLAMSVTEALAVLRHRRGARPAAHAVLARLADVGLGYRASGPAAHGDCGGVESRQRRRARTRMGDGRRVRPRRARPAACTSPT